MNVEEYLEKKKALDEALKSNAKDMVKSFFDKFFADNPTIDEVLWVQYTPYFNDGDACVFGVNDPCYRRVGVARPDYPCPWGEDEEFFSSWDMEDKEEKKSIMEFERDFNKMEDIFEQLGDHSMVSVQRDGTVEVTDFDHD